MTDETASPKQKQWLVDLGVDPLPEDLTKVEASRWIDEVRLYNSARERGTIPQGARSDVYKVPPGRQAQTAPASQVAVAELRFPPPSAPDTSVTTTATTGDGKAIGPTTTPVTGEVVEPVQGFRTADQIARERGIAQSVAPAGELAASDYVMAPVMNLEQAKKVWNSFLSLKSFLLTDPACYDVIGGSAELNRTGATRLATAFGLTTEVVSIVEGRVEESDSGNFDYRFLVTARVSRGSRHADGIASCRMSEIADKTKKGEPVPYSQREHFALTKASTRATKRAIADILGGTEAE